MSRVFIAIVPIDSTHVKVEKIEASTWYEAREKARSLPRFGEPEVASERSEAKRAAHAPRLRQEAEAMSKVLLDPHSEAIVRLIEILEPHREEIERLFRENVDSTPVVGFLPQFFELRKRDLLGPLGALLGVVKQRKG